MLQQYRFTRSIFKRSLFTNNFLLKSCIGCKTEIEDEALVCKEPNCQEVQPCIEVNYFKVFQMDPVFEIDCSKLKSEYLKYQRLVHPDKFYQGDKEKLDNAYKVTSLINKAYANLNDPTRRASYLLKLKGHEVEETENLVDPTLLMEVMEFNESLDVCNSKVELNLLKKELEVRISDTISKLEQNFKDEDLVRAKQNTVQLKYFHNIFDRIVQHQLN